jgi:hypothetical protein
MRALVAEFVSGEDKIFRPDNETFVPSGSSIRVQPFTGLFLARFRKNPAVAAAGS